MSNKLLLNSDLGESFGNWNMGVDELVMPQVDMANIACGGHAGDPKTMLSTVKLAKQHNTIVGAHPGYPDKLGFGRKHIPFESSELQAHIIYQVSALIGIASGEGANVEYVKPHGALYNDMMQQQPIRFDVYSAIAKLKGLNAELKLMMLATADNQTYIDEAKQFDIEIIFEAFADRRYTDNGLLTPRSNPGAVLNHQQMLNQISTLKAGFVETANGTKLSLEAQTICVHGDNPEAVEHIKDIRRLLES